MINKRGLVWSEIVWWIIGAAVLVLIIALIIILKNSGTNIFEKIANILRFGR